MKYVNSIFHISSFSHIYIFILSFLSVEDSDFSKWNYIFEESIFILKDVNSIFYIVFFFSYHWISFQTLPSTQTHTQTHTHTHTHIYIYIALLPPIFYFLCGQPECRCWYFNWKRLNVNFNLKCDENMNLGFLTIDFQMSVLGRHLVLGYLMMSGSLKLAFFRLLSPYLIWKLVLLSSKI